MSTRIIKHEKDDGAVLDFTLDWSEWLATGDTISTSTWAVPAGITKDSDNNTTTATTIWVSGGTAGTRYILTNTITTAGGRTESKVIILDVVDVTDV